MTFKWIAEPRVVPALRRMLNPGDEFDAEPRIGNGLVAQGLAIPTLDFDIATGFEIVDIHDDDQWSDDEP